MVPCPLHGLRLHSVEPFGLVSRNEQSNNPDGNDNRNGVHTKQEHHEEEGPGILYKTAHASGTLTYSTKFTFLNERKACASVS